MTDQKHSTDQSEERSQKAHAEAGEKNKQKATQGELFPAGTCKVKR